MVKKKMVAAFLFDKYRTVSLVTGVNNEGSRSCSRPRA